MKQFLSRYLLFPPSVLLWAGIFCMATALGQNRYNPAFARQNIVAWCIVPFDSSHRGPVERAEMLNALGITKLAYDWRQEHLPTFDNELDALNAHSIRLQAFWMISGQDPSADDNVKAIFSFLKRRKVHPQIWYMYVPPAGFDAQSQPQKIAQASAAVRYVATQAAAIGCEVGLYNHEGWFGEPDNQLAILDRLHMRNLGMVYNFNHAQYQIDRFPEFFPRILPHLIALNLAGLKKGDEHIFPIGKGNSEAQMIRLVWQSNFKGPIGIINENTHPDAKTGLEMNMKGLRGILYSLGDRGASSTYK